MRVINSFGLSAEAAQVLPHLLQFTPEHRNQARELQGAILTFQAELQAALEEMWPNRANDDAGGAGELNVTSWAERMEERRRERENAVKSIVKPALGATDSSWRVDILDV